MVVIFREESGLPGKLWCGELPPHTARGPDPSASREPFQTVLRCHAAGSRRGEADPIGGILVPVELGLQEAVAPRGRGQLRGELQEVRRDDAGLESVTVRG